MVGDRDIGIITTLLKPSYLVLNYYIKLGTRMQWLWWLKRQPNEHWVVCLNPDRIFFYFTSTIRCQKLKNGISEHYWRYVSMIINSTKSNTDCDLLCLNSHWSSVSSICVDVAFQLAEKFSMFTFQLWSKQVSRLYSKPCWVHLTPTILRVVFQCYIFHVWKLWLQRVQGNWLGNKIFIAFVLKEPFGLWCLYQFPFHISCNS